MALVLSGDSGFDLPNGAELAVGEGGTGANNDSDARVNLGLGNVDNVSASDLRDRSTHTGTQPLSTISDAGTIASQDANSVNIDGGTIDGTAVNATTLTASGDVNFDSGTLFVDESTNRVGIGTTSPGADLSIVRNNSGGQVGLHINNTSTSASQYSVIRMGTDVVGGSPINIHAFDGSWSGSGAFASNAGNIDCATGTLTLSSSNASGTIQFYTTGIASDKERMRIDTGGRVTTPNQPTFWAWHSGGGSESTSTTNTPIPFDLTKVNIGSHYNTSTYRFTTPISGTYQFFGSLLHRQSDSTGSGEWNFYVNGSIAVGNRGIAYAGAGTADGDHDQATATIILPLSANDYVDMRLTSIGSGQNFYYGNGLGHFGGYLLG